MFKKVKLLSLFLALNIVFSFALPIFAVENEKPKCKYCDFSQMYVENDKYEGFNRKMFNLNSKLNKFIAKPVHILWSSILPQYGLDRLKGVYDNIEYPKRLASCLIQKDFKGAKTETQRFITNTTIGLGGMFDPAQKFMKLKPVSENMDQALCHCKVKSGPYLVMPVLSSSCPRSLLGRMIEAALDPSAYLGTPIAALAKLGLVINKTSYMQPLAEMIESTYADPYDIAKKLYGIESYIKTNDLDRKNLLYTDAKILPNGDEIIANVASSDEIKGLINDLNEIKNEEAISSNRNEISEGDITGLAADMLLTPDIILTDYNPQSPVVDSMRTALFDSPDIMKSMWNEISIWNHSFFRRLKTGSVAFNSNRDEYKYKYILQKNKNAPLAIIYPSIGEGAKSYHSAVFAKIFYDAGYSVLIQGSHFQWEFVKSMPEGFCPGLPKRDAKYLRNLTAKILDDLQAKHKCEFSNKILIGTSFGAMETLFIANEEESENTLGISKYIAISPPIELIYAMQQVDKNSESFDKDSDDAKQKAAVTAAKIIQINELKDSPDFKFSEMPFTEEEGKLIVSFIMRQKLSDLVFTIEGIKKGQKTDFYDTMNNLSYQNYVEKYVLKDIDSSIEELAYDTSLYSISDFLKMSDKYKIYHSLDDFLVNKNQIEQLKRYSPNQVICLNHGSHLGFLYRDEFLDSFKNEIRIN